MLSTTFEKAIAESEGTRSKDWRCQTKMGRQCICEAKTGPLEH